VVQISSLQNPRVKAIRRLRMRKYRTIEQRYLIEGPRIVHEALDRKAPVEALLYCPELLQSEHARAMVQSHTEMEHVVLSRGVFEGLSGRDNPQGLAAVVRFSHVPLKDLVPGPDALILVAWQLQTPGNLGSIIRTADAAGAEAIVIIEPSVDLYDPLTVRATMGSLYALPIAMAQGDAEWFAWLERVRCEGVPLRVLGTSAHGSALIWDTDSRGPLALLIGSEQAGLPDSVRSSADIMTRLPMAGRASSLNVSAATAAIVFEVLRQRRSATPPPA